MAERLRRTLEGPPVPNSPRPQVVAGPILRRALLLRDQIPATGHPGGPTIDIMDRRMFVDVYDDWPSPGPITHLRVGNRKAIGWVPSMDVLEWSTRLIVRSRDGSFSISDGPEGSARRVQTGMVPLPVLAWTDRAVEVALWNLDKPWSSVERRGWIRLDELLPEQFGVWISQVELPILLGLANQGNAPELVRLRAVIGRLAENRTWSDADLEAARLALPRFVFQREPDSRTSAGRLAEVNARPNRDAAWSGLTFCFLPLDALP